MQPLNRKSQQTEDLGSYKRFGSLLRDLRLRMGWTRADVASRAGVTLPTLVAYETGTSLPGGKDLFNIIHLFEHLQPKATESLVTFWEELMGLHPNENREQLQIGFTIRIQSDPLTAQDLTKILSAITRIYTKCRLMSQYRFADVIRYSISEDRRFDDEAKLFIAQLSHNSPTLLELKPDQDTGGIIDAFRRLFNDIINHRLRFSKQKQDIEQEKKKSEQELIKTQEEITRTQREFEQAQQITQAFLQMKVEDHQEDIEDRRQARTIAALEAEIRIARDLEALKLQAIATREKEIELRLKELDLLREQEEVAQQLVAPLVDRISPHITGSTRSMLIETVAPDVRVLQEYDMELLPSPGHQEENETDNDPDEP